MCLFVFLYVHVCVSTCVLWFAYVLSLLCVDVLEMGILSLSLFLRVFLLRTSFHRFHDVLRRCSADKDFWSFSWEGLRRTREYYQRRGITVYAVVTSHAAHKYGVPIDLEDNVITAPKLGDRNGAAVLMMLRPSHVTSSCAGYICVRVVRGVKLQLSSLYVFVMARRSQRL